jgi:hypothetical protein
MVSIADMGHPSRYPLDDYVTSIVSGVTPQPESEPSGGLSSERAAELGERLRQLQSARQTAESESRDYPVS